MSPEPTPGTQQHKTSVSDDDQQIIDLAAELHLWSPTEAQSLLPLAKWSLESVTHLTEYEDEKANRILTAIAFLSALVGVAFAAIVQRFPFSIFQVLSISGRQAGGRILISVYSLFGLYFLLLTAGAVLTLWAVQPRFRIPSVWRTKSTPASFLFFSKILEVSGKNWANAFTGASVDQLESQYVKNSILETYLIAQKIPKKLRPLTWGVRFFIASAVVLILLLPLCAIAVIYVDVSPPTPIANGASGTVQPEFRTTKEPESQTVQPETASQKGVAEKSRQLGNNHTEQPAAGRSKKH